MQVMIAREGNAVHLKATESVSHDVLAMVGASDIVKARMGDAVCAVFEVELRRFPCTCAKIPVPCRCKKSATIVEVGERLA